MPEPLQAAFLGMAGDFHATYIREAPQPYRLEWAGGRIEEITGYSVAEIGRKGRWMSFVHPEDAAEVAGTLENLRADGNSTLRFRIRARSGALLWVELRARAVPREAGPPGALRLLCIFRDITEQHEARAIEARSLDNLQDVTRTAAAINEAPDEESALGLLGHAALRLEGDGLVVLTTRDPFRPVIHVRGIYGGAAHTIAVITRIMGRNPFQIETPLDRMDPENLTIYASGRPARLPDMHFFTAGTIPRPICQMLEKVLRVRSVWAVGFARGGNFLGGLTLLRRVDGTPPALALLETLVRQTSVVLDRRRAEEALRATLSEKEILLREIHHRVKNNMQVVSSLIGLQTRDVADPAAREVFRGLRDRIRTMALTHEKLYRSDDLARVDMSGYLRELTDHLHISIPRRPERLRLTVAAEALPMDVGTAIPIGLIVNELVTNALKHAFPDDREGSLEVRLEKAGRKAYRLTVRDDGKGVPDAQAGDATLGMQIVRMLTSQIDGTLRVRNRPGAEFVVDFPEAPGKS